MKAQIIEESEYGTYVWVMPNGEWMGDDEGNFLCVASKKGDVNNLRALRTAAYNYLRDMGLEPQGKPGFLSGRRPISDSEWEEQNMRARAGLTPDPYDVAALKEEAYYANRRND